MEELVQTIVEEALDVADESEYSVPVWDRTRYSAEEYLEMVLLPDCNAMLWETDQLLGAMQERMDELRAQIEYIESIPHSSETSLNSLEPIYDEYNALLEQRQLIVYQRDNLAGIVNDIREGNYESAAVPQEYAARTQKNLAKAAETVSLLFGAV